MINEMEKGVLDHLDVKVKSPVNGLLVVEAVELPGVDEKTVCVTTSGGYTGSCSSAFACLSLAVQSMAESMLTENMDYSDIVEDINEAMKEGLSGAVKKYIRDYNEKTLL